LFRFVNPAWTREVCEAFASDLRSMPSVRLHGDAHIEQYALTSEARGLDDFDDSAKGPAVVDIVRFLGSLQLAARDRGWEASLPAITDAFISGYRRGLEDPAYLPPDPAVVVRLRAKGVPSREEFLAWADSLMQPLSREDLARVDAARGRLQAYATQIDPAFTPEYLAIKRIGELHLGIGSALARKLLFRVEGPSPAPDDDVVVEAKEVSLLPHDSCLIVPNHAEVYRVVEGLGQIGRIEHRLVVALPVLPDAPSSARGGWWVRMWERSYRELEVGDLASAGELMEVAHDAGAQLGATNLTDAPQRLGRQARMAEIEGLTRLGPRIRTVTHELTLALIDAWQQMRTQSATP